MENLNLIEVMKQPSKYFDTPKDVLKDEKLSIKEKREVLKSWKSQCVNISKSESEGMSANNSKAAIHLSDVVSALDLVNS